MVSLRFPFSFSQPRRQPNSIPNSATSRRLNGVSIAFAIAAGAAAFAGVSAIHDPTKQKHPLIKSAVDLLLGNRGSLLPWGSLSLADDVDSVVVEEKTGASFPEVVRESQRLLGIGIRKKSVLGLKNIDVYAFGVYANEDEVKKYLGEKYGKLTDSELKESREFKDDIMENDISMTIRLCIVYGRLSIRSVRSAFEQSVGSRLQKFGGPDTKELLQRFTSQFKDEYKIPRDSIIELSREPGHVLRTTINGDDVGSIQSKVLCRSILDLYIGEDPFDRKAKEETESKLASLVQK